MDISTLQKRVDQLLERSQQRNLDAIPIAYELLEGAISLMSAVYGPESAQIISLRELAKSVQNRKEGVLRRNAEDISEAATGALSNLKGELEAGAIGSLQRRFEGGVLTDFILLARSVLDEDGDNAKNVGAVLAAAAFEDTIRRMGEITGRSTTGIDLSEVINALKVAGILQAPQLGIALSYLNFRNHALHARWAQIDRASINSVLAFVEELLLKHFQ